MMTARQIERWWTNRDHARLARECLAGRAEAVESIRGALARTEAAAALALIRLDELGQATSLVPVWLRTVVEAQGDEGGWDDPLLTGLCARALLTHRSHLDRAHAGIASLARLQRDDGAWPREPLRRMPGDALATAYILLQLVNDETFRGVVRVADAVRWLQEQQQSLCGDAAALTRVALLRSASHGPARLAVPTRLQAA